MAAEWSDIVVAGTAAMGLLGSAVAFSIKWVHGGLKTLRSDMDGLAQRNDASHADIHERINDTREHWVPKGDFEKDLVRIEARVDTGMRALADEIRGVGTSMNARIDQLLGIFAKKFSE